MSKERPILFSASMVRPLLDGSKTQTRRVLKTQPTHFNPVGIPRRARPDGPSDTIYCPYGQPGDSLWVRENFQPFWADGVSSDWQTDWKTGKGFKPSYPATDGVQEFLDSDDNLRATVKPSIHMPRWASRILLEIVSVRVERLQDISDADIVAEGIDMNALAESQDRYDIVCKGSGTSGRATERTAWRELWESTGGDWDANEWLWVIEFKRVMP